MVKLNENLAKTCPFIGKGISGYTLLNLLFLLKTSISI